MTHTWEQCYPTRLAPPEPDPWALSYAAMVWMFFPPRYRKLLHEYLCEGERTPEHLQALTVFTDFVAYRIGTAGRTKG